MHSAQHTRPTLYSFWLRLCVFFFVRSRPNQMLFDDDYVDCVAIRELVTLLESFESGPHLFPLHLQSFRRPIPLHLLIC